MDLLRKIVILFLIIFNFRIPVLYNSTVLCVILTSLYYIFIRKSIPFNYFFHRYNVRVLIGLVLICIVCLLVTFLHNEYEYTLFKVLTLQLFMLCSLIFALPLLIDENNESTSFEQISVIVCYVFAVQGFIQLLGFLIPPFGDFLISMKPIGIQDAVLDSAFDVKFRGYALTGSPFFELPAGFGVAFILFFRILLTPDQKMITGYKKFVVFFLLLLGSILSGRTAYIGLLMGIIMSLFFLKNPIGLLLKFIWQAGIFVLLLIFVYTFLLRPSQKHIFENYVMPFAFEFFYTYESTGEFKTGSTDVMIEQHYFKLPIETLMHGDGRYLGVDGFYYKNTDAGYMRSVLYGGIPFLLCLIIYQSLYFLRPIFMARSGGTRDDKMDLYCLLTLFLHLFILEYKGDAIGTQNIMEVLLLFIGTGYMVRHYWRKENEYIAD